MRIQYELERILPSQVSAELVWFLAPTVSLCSQQYEYIESQLSAVQVKFLSGADGVERWTEQSLWDGVLRNVRVVVSTYQILLDALTHAFVKMDQLALIVFDEGIFPPASESVAQVTAQSA
jgi:ERCC4-related helicase